MRLLRRVSESSIVMQTQVRESVQVCTQRYSKGGELLVEWLPEHGGEPLFNRTGSACSPQEHVGEVLIPSIPIEIEAGQSCRALRRR